MCGARPIAVNLTASRTDGDSAVAYFFSRELRCRLNCPVGVLHASVGATPIQNWSPGGKGYERMIEPLAPYGIRGAIWYQGESNLGSADRLVSMRGLLT